MADKRPKMPRPMAIADLLGAVFRGKPAEKRLEEGKVWLVWDEAVGKQIAARAQPVSLRDGILTVAVSSAPWMQQLTFLKQGMIDSINERLGRELVRDIYLKAGMREAPPPRSEPAIKRGRPLTGEETLRIKEHTDSVRDPDLREAFSRLLTHHLENQRPATKKP